METFNKDTGEVIEAEFVNENSLAVQQKTEMAKDFNPDGANKNIKMLNRVLNEVLEEGKDYGTVPGCKDKLCLFKTGMEKISMCFGLNVETSSVITPLNGDHINVVSRAKVSHRTSSTPLATMSGTCSTMEKKYRYRWDNGERVENPDPAEQWNTVVKMAEKRAAVAAVLIATGASSLFTQDLEDMDKDSINNGRQSFKPSKSKAVTSAPSNGGVFITKASTFGKGDALTGVETSDGEKYRCWTKDRKTGGLSVNHTAVMKCFEEELEVHIHYSEESFNGNSYKQIQNIEILGKGSGDKEVPEDCPF